MAPRRFNGTVPIKPTSRFNFWSSNDACSPWSQWHRIAPQQNYWFPPIYTPSIIPVFLCFLNPYLATGRHCSYLVFRAITNPVQYRRLVLQSQPNFLCAFQGLYSFEVRTDLLFHVMPSLDFVDVPFPAQFFHRPHRGWFQDRRCLVSRYPWHPLALPHAYNIRTTWNQCGTSKQNPTESN